MENLSYDAPCSNHNVPGEVNVYRRGGLLGGTSYALRDAADPDAGYDRTQWVAWSSCAGGESPALPSRDAAVGWLLGCWAAAGAPELGYYGPERAEV